MTSTRQIVLAVLLVTASACSYTNKVALLSEGDLAGRRLEPTAPGPRLKGEDCGGPYHYLSTAFRDAVKESGYDTLMDVDVTSTTGVFGWSNCIVVEGSGVKSSTLPTLKQE